MKNKSTHGGKRKGAGRKPAPDPVFTKKFRASESERIEFLSLLTGDARKDFEIVFQAVRASLLANTACTGLAGTVAKDSEGNQPASR